MNDRLHRLNCVLDTSGTAVSEIDQAGKSHCWQIPIALVLGVVALAQLVMPASIAAQDTRIWDDVDSANSYFEVPSNWVGGNVPDSDDNVLFNSSGNHQVWFDGATDIPEVGSIQVTNGNITFVNRNATVTNPFFFGLTGNGPLGFGLDIGTPGAASGRRFTMGGFDFSAQNARVNEFSTLNLEGSDPAGMRFDASDRIYAIGGTINSRDGAIVTSARAIADSDNTFTTGILNVSGAGSQWDNSGNLTVGGLGRGELNITSGGVFNTDTSQIGAGLGDIRGTVIVSGTDSAWNTTNETIIGGPNTTGVASSNAFSNIQILNGGRATTGQLTAGVRSGSLTSIRVDGPDAVYDVAGQAIIADRAEASLRIENGGRFEATGLGLATSAGSIGSIAVQGEDSELSLSGAFDVGIQGDAQLTVQDSGKVNASSMTVNSFDNAVVTLRDAGSEISSGTIRVGSTSTGNFSISAGGNLNAGDATIGATATGQGTLTVSDSGSRWNSSGLVTVGQSGVGEVLVQSGGSAGSKDAIIGSDTSGIGTVVVSGTGSEFSALTSLVVGDAGLGTLTFESGGSGNGDLIVLGNQLGGEGTINVAGGGSVLSMQSMNAGVAGTGNINVSDQGNLISINSTLAAESTGVARVSVSGPGSQWTNAGDLTIGVGGVADLTVGNDGTLSVSGTTSIGSKSQVNLLGGNFEFGEGRLEEFANINSVSGKLVGSLSHSSYTDVATLTGFRPSAVDMSDVLIKNDGVLRGSGELNDFLLQNSEIGEIQTFTGEQMRLGGSVENFGEIKSFGGLLRIEGNLINDSSGFISGRGVLITGQGIDNLGVLAFSGDTDIEGDVTMSGGSQLVTSGFATTTIFDDLNHNGAEIRTSNGSALVVLGGATGAGDYTGTGTVFFEGDLRPGNSPDIVNFEGDVVLGSSANTVIELGGESLGMFDQLAIAGSLDLDGELSVALIDGFSLSNDMQFLFADVGGVLSGEFDGYGEGDLVGTFGGQNLFITYGGFNGNSGVGLFTSAVPEPTTTCLLGSLLTLTLLRRRRG